MIIFSNSQMCLIMSQNNDRVIRESFLGQIQVSEGAISTHGYPLSGNLLSRPRVHPRRVQRQPGQRRRQVEGDARGSDGPGLAGRLAAWPRAACTDARCVVVRRRGCALLLLYGTCQSYTCRSTIDIDSTCVNFGAYLIYWGFGNTTVSDVAVAVVRIQYM